MTASRLFLVLSALLVVVLLWPAGPSVPAVETYRADPAEFRGRHLALLAAFGTGEAVNGMPLVRPPPGSDVPVLVRRWEFSPALELEAGKTYRLHLLAEDTVHAAVLGEQEVMLVPGEARVLILTAPASGRVRLQCGEYCGLGHTRMIGHIEVR